MTGPELAQAARSLTGVPFRLHGRDPRHGLDCIGVLEAAWGKETLLPNGYALRTRNPPPLAPLAERLGLNATEGPIEPGDVVLVRPSACQHHLAIATAPDCFVHAHAGLRRVVEGPLPAAWPRIGHWRLP